MIDWRRYDDVCVYVHRRKSDAAVFYVGLSGGRKRPYDFENRNPYWKNIAKKHGVIVEIVKEGMTYEEAAELEVKLIQQYSVVYEMANLTKGGETPINPFKPNKKPNKRVNTAHKAKTPKKAKKAKKQPKNASKLESVIFMMSGQYSIRQIAKKLSISASLVRKIIS